MKDKDKPTLLEVMLFWPMYMMERTGKNILESGYKLPSIMHGSYIRSKYWKAIADDKKEQAGWCCQLCNRSKDETTLHAHHRTYERLGFEAPEDITVLCARCHAKFHGVANG